MSHVRKKVEWCLRKAEKELRDSDTHRGLVKNEPNADTARKHVAKAEHYLKATLHLKEGGFSDISASTIFYVIYHCFLAIAAKNGYVSRNQECTFALMVHLIEQGKVSIEKKDVEAVAPLALEDTREQTTLEVREQYQYGTSLSLEDAAYEKQLALAKKILSKTKLVLEE